MDFPDFIGIGAPRAATTWLYNVLSMHSQIWMPPLKELHYFDVEDPSVDRISFRKKHIFVRLKYNLAFITKFIWKKKYPQYVDKVKIDLLFDVKYIFGIQNDKWYRSLFSKKFRKEK